MANPKIRHRELVPALVVGLAALYLGVQWSLLRALFLPRNFLDTLHGVEVVLLALLAFDLWWRLRRGRRPQLVLLTTQGQRHAVRGSLVFGSRPGGGGVTLPGPQVSRHHLEVRRVAGGGLVALDVGSTNGTFLRGEDLRQQGTVRLEAGDRLELGRGGPELRCATEPAAGVLSDVAQVAAWLGLLWIGLYLGWRANLERLPAEIGLTENPAAGDVVVDFRAFHSFGAWCTVALLASTAGLAFFLGRRRHAAAADAGTALQVLLALGLAVLYPLLPAVGLRYAEAAVKQRGQVERLAGAGAWEALAGWESDERRQVDAVLDQEDPPGSFPGLPAFAPRTALASGQLESVLRSYRRGRQNFILATNLASRGQAGAERPSLGQIGYFRQALVLIAALFLGLVVPQRFPGVRELAEGFLDRLKRPISQNLVSAADHGSPLARWLRPIAYWDVVCGFAAAAVVALTLLFGTGLGRGKRLYLPLPGVTVQSVELVKALFVLFMAGFFARQGALLVRAPRSRYLLPYVLAALCTLALTAVQADMGGLFMLGLFLALVFVAATGYLRLVLTVPLLLLPGFLIAVVSGQASVVATRLGIWFSPRTHPAGEQVVQARQLLLASDWGGFVPAQLRAHLVPDIHGDFVLAAFAERFGLLGLASLLVVWFVLVASLLGRARRATPGAALLLASVAALVLVQVLTQAGGTMGLLPLTGVPIPWLSQGLSASLIFTLLLALALAVAGDAPPWAARPADHNGPLRYLEWANAGSWILLLVLAVYWMEVLPRTDAAGVRGRDYRWQSSARLEQIRAQIGGLFECVENSSRVRVAATGEDVDREALEARAVDLRCATDEDGKLRPQPRTYLYKNPNRFAGRSLPSGGLWTRDGKALARTVEGARDYPFGEKAWHPVGYSGPLAQKRGADGALGAFLRDGMSFDDDLRQTAFLHDVHHGPDVVLTLHSALQEKAFDRLVVEGERRGAAVVMDLHDGSLLVLASSPAVDPTGAAVTDWKGFEQRGDKPLRNRATHSTDVYSPPGSVFKVVVAAALHLGGESGFSTRCPGRDRDLRVSCAHNRAHGAIGLDRALAVSCNVYFARAAVHLGGEKVRQASELFGFNQGPLDLLRHETRLPEEAKLLAASSTVTPPKDGAEGLNRAEERDLARLGFGQGGVNATPLGITLMGAVVATGGEWVEPRLDRAIELYDGDEPVPGTSYTLALPRLSRRKVRADVADALGEALAGVFERGTARALKLWRGPDGRYLTTDENAGDRIPPCDDCVLVPVAGKTGSAQKSAADKVEDAWMVLWAPADIARVVVTVMVEDAGEGGAVAGPIAIELLGDALNVLENGGMEDEEDEP